MQIRKYNLRLVCCVWILFALVISSHAADRAIKRSQELSHGSDKLGAYKALIIGIDQYSDPKIPDLKTAVKDARAIAEILEHQYGFTTQLLLNEQANRSAIYQALRTLAGKSKEHDSVLIYYAGHGDMDRMYDDGWWIPADARGGDPLTYLDNNQIQKAMRKMAARHVLLISDSCYSGTLFGESRSIPPVITDTYYQSLYNEKSRWGMTSGNKTPVSDSGSGGHSVFAYQLLKELKRTDRPYMSTQELYTRIAPIISNNSEQTPLCRPVRNTGDQGGEFIFVRVAGNSAVADEKIADHHARQQSYQLNYVYRTTGKGPQKELINGSLLRSGDHYKILFTPEQNTYVYIFQSDSSGQIFQLFPITGFSNPVLKDRPYTVPATDKAFQLDSRIGTERIYFIGSGQRHHAMENLYQELADARRVGNRQKVEDAQSRLHKYFKRRGVAGIVSDEKITIDWKQDTYSLMARRLEGLNDAFVNVIEFRHQDPVK